MYKKHIDTGLELMGSMGNVVCDINTSGWHWICLGQSHAAQQDRYRCNQ